jgi:pantoate--beta-alanine ligase
VTRVVTTRESLASAYEALPPGTPRGVVLTMGSMHAGHARLMRETIARVGPEGHVTVTVFVNPTQFGPDEDLDRYPRSLEDDVAVCAREGADLVFAPSVDTVYPDGDPIVTVDPGPLGTLLEGAVRPGHFRGVLTVVHKLLSLTGASLTSFGEKDYQQLVLVRRMVRDLDLPVHVVGVPTARDADGLALSSRNAYLSGAEREQAQAIPAAIDAGVTTAAQGHDAAGVLDAVHDVLARAELPVDYAVVTDPGLGPAPGRGEARLLLAVPVGPVRLLDNARLDLQEARWT